MENFNNFLNQQIWSNNKSLLHHVHQAPSNVRGEITSTEKGSILAPSKLAQSQPPHSTNLSSIDNRLYLDGLRYQQQSRQSSYSNGSLTISPAGGSGSSGSRDSNNNGLSSQSIAFTNQKLLTRLDIDTMRSNINSHRSGSNMLHHQHGTILFNTLNGGALGAGVGNGLMSSASAECFTGPDLVDSTTPPPTAISMPPASSASSSSSTISTNVGLNRNSNGSQEGSASTEKIKTPNSIRGEQKSEGKSQTSRGYPRKKNHLGSLKSKALLRSRRKISRRVSPRRREIGREMVRRKTRLAEQHTEWRNFNCIGNLRQEGARSENKNCALFSPLPSLSLRVAS
jgi:hypothetical protein